MDYFNNTLSRPYSEITLKFNHRVASKLNAYYFNRGTPNGIAPPANKKKSKHHGLSNIQIVQEVSSAPPPSPRPCCPTSPAPPPGTPLLHSRRMDSASVCSMQPPPSPHMGYQHFNNSSYHIGAPVYPNSRSSHCFNVSVPPSPSMSVGCRSPVLQRKANYSTMEVRIMKQLLSTASLILPSFIGDPIIFDNMLLLHMK